VSVGDDVFAPRTITIDPDDEVTWRNDGETVHTVTADEGVFDSASLAAGAQFSFTFSQPGTYAYYCAVHGAPGGVGMAGKVVVRGAAAEPSTEGPNDQAPTPGATAAPATLDTLPATGASWAAGLLFALALLVSGTLLLLITSRRSAGR